VAPLVPPGTRAVFFDAVGTLIHPEPPAPAVYAEAARRFGSRLDLPSIAARFHTAFCRQEELDHAGGLRTDEAREVARWRAIVAEVLDDVTDPEGCFAFLYAHFARPTAWRCDPEAAAVVAALASRGYRLGIASNFDARLRQVAAGLPGLAPIEFLVISSEVGWRKPAPEFFHQMCALRGEFRTSPERQRGVSLPPSLALGAGRRVVQPLPGELRPDEVLLVGDDPVNDYAGARACGLHALLYDPAGTEPVPEAARLLRWADLLGPVR
jgi:putative hydrolase of the HAD superfamily